MGFLFPDPKKISKKEIEKKISGSKYLTKEQKEYAKGIFNDPHAGKGLTESQVRKEIEHLKRDTGDPISSFRAKKLKEGIGEAFEEDNE